MSLLSQLQQAVADGLAEPLELALWDFAQRHDGRDAVALSLAATARAVAEGHSCLDLGQQRPCLPGQPPPWTLAELNPVLRNSPLVGDPEQARPLILDQQRLYLQRYWAYEAKLAGQLQRLCKMSPAPVDPELFTAATGWFAQAMSPDAPTDWQAVAAFAALRQRFCIISGGPGTGKTHTILRLVAMLCRDAMLAGEAAPKVALAAPTGKAAMRMMAAIRQGLPALRAADGLSEVLPDQAQTLHRLLGLGRRGPKPRYDADNPLPADVIIVDEASMIDLAMMAKLCAALAPHARLILLGDPQQLASVEAGSVLAELCQLAEPNSASPAQQNAMAALLRTTLPAPASMLSDHVVHLKVSRRFGGASAIGRLAASINAGDAAAALKIFDTEPEVQCRDPDTDVAAELARLTDHFQMLCAQETPDDALTVLSRHGLLCVLRRGPLGSVRINQFLEDKLRAGLDIPAGQLWYQGRPVIVTSNDYTSGLFNGDVGIAWPDDRGQLKVWFEGDVDGTLRSFLPGSLPQHELAFALTVHKSQGSEFEQVTLILPEQDSPLLTREMLYTGITRAKSGVHVLGKKDIFLSGLKRSIQRFSGLASHISRPSAD